MDSASASLKLNCALHRVAVASSASSSRRSGRESTSRLRIRNLTKEPRLMRRGASSRGRPPAAHTPALSLVSSHAAGSGASSRVVTPAAPPRPPAPHPPVSGLRPSVAGGWKEIPRAPPHFGAGLGGAPRPLPRPHTMNAGECACVRLVDAAARRRRVCCLTAPSGCVCGGSFGGAHACTVEATTNFFLID
jgi:hypothetical protein